MKKICVCYICKETPITRHKLLFKNTDFYFITTDKSNKEALDFCENLNHNEIRYKFINLINKKYEYYLLFDENIIFNDNLIEEKIINILNEYNPPICDFLNNHSNTTEVLPCSAFKCNYNIKIIHHSLYNFIYNSLLIYPDSSREFFFNILEIPYIKYSLVIKTPFEEKQSLFNINNSDVNCQTLLCGFYPYYQDRYKNKYHTINAKSHNIPKIENYFSYSNINKFIENCKKMYTYQSINKNNFLENKNWLTENILNEIFDLNWFVIQKSVFNKSRKNILVVVGNGPSLKEEYFELFKKYNIDTFGLNAAYRFFNENWMPTYYGCFDYALTLAHQKNIENIMNDESYKIEKYFLIEIPSIEAEVKTTSRYFDDEIEKHPKFVGRPHNQDGVLFPKYGTNSNKISCTGCNAIRTGIELGYEHIILIGHDANYEPPSHFKNKVKSDGKAHVYTVTDKIDNNPNYFWNNYQQKNDIFNNPGGVMNVWNRFSNLVNEYNKLSDKKVKIYNCSNISKINHYEKREMAELLEYLNGLY